MSLTQRSKDPLPDVNACFKGTCGTCGTVHTQLYHQLRQPSSRRPTNREPGTWNDLPTSECPKCKATVFMRKMHPLPELG